MQTLFIHLSKKSKQFDVNVETGHNLSPGHGHQLLKYPYARVTLQSCTQKSAKLKNKVFHT